MGQMCLILAQISSSGEFLFLLLLSILFSYGVACLGKKRKIGFGWAFVFSLVLNPLAGLIIVLCSKKKDTEFIDVNK